MAKQIQEFRKWLDKLNVREYKEVKDELYELMIYLKEYLDVLKVKRVGAGRFKGDAV